MNMPQKSLDRLRGAWPTAQAMLPGIVIGVSAAYVYADYRAAGSLAATPSAFVLALAVLLAGWLSFSRRLVHRDAQTANQATQPSAAGTREAVMAYGMINRAPVLVAYVDSNRKFQFVNATGARWIDKLRTTLVDADVEQALGPLNWFGANEPLARALAGTPALFEWDFVCLDTGRMRLGTTMLPDRREDGTIAGCQIVAVDTTKYGEAIEAAQRSERRLRLIMDQIPVTITYIDSSYTYRYINRAQELWLGKSYQEVVNRRVIDVTGEKVFADIEPNIKTALSGNVVPVERRRVDRAGNVVWHSGRHVPDVNDDGEVIGTYTVFFDVTQRANAEISLREREKELESAMEAAKAASRAKSQFLATMSHEIRTPMNGVLGMAELLLGSGLDDNARKIAETIHRSGSLLLRIVNDILDFSKVEAGKMELENAPFDLRNFAEEIVETMADGANSKGLEMTLQVADDLAGTFIGDPLRLRQIMTNLIGNAIKFTEQGEVSVEFLRATADQLPPSMSTAQQDLQDRVLVRVKDTGIGMNEETLGRLFAAFTQADGSTTRKYGGTGLGLAICKQLVELMGGRIGAESWIGGGSTLWFTVQLKSEGQPAKPQPASAAFAGVRTLVVDDNATNREIIARQLRSLGMKITTAPHGTRALEMLHAAADRDEPYRLVITDQHMPVLDGPALVASIQSAPTLAAIPVVLLTSAKTSDDPADARATGISARLAKPVRPAELARTITDIIEGKETRAPERNVAAEKQPARAVAPTSNETRAPERNLATENTAPRFDAHILLVEDNPVNRDIGVMILEGLGCTVECAEDGLIGVRATEQKRFDIILMDCQMPNMDGYEATREIRLREAQMPVAAPGAAPSRNTIIAITANAMPDDRELCLEAGMDDYLPKPYRRDQLAEILGRWLRRQDSAPRRLQLVTSRDAPSAPPARSDAAPAPLDSTGSTLPAFDAGVLKEVLPQGAGLESELARKLLNLFASDAGKLIAEIERACSAGDCNVAYRTAHTLKSSGGLVGAMAISTLARELEAEARAGHAASLAGYSASLRRELERFLVDAGVQRLTAQTAAA
jgi:PAS domain S-box-containing protein